MSQSRHRAAVLLVIVLMAVAACEPHHLMKVLPQDAVMNGGAAGTGGATGEGGATGVGGQGTGGARGFGGSGGVTFPGTGGSVVRDASVTDAAFDGGLRAGSITVTALIDGQDLLHISSTGVYWEHVTRAGPGMHNYQTLATDITSDTAGDVTWCPQWMNGCNTCDGSCGELRDRNTSAVLPLDIIPGVLVSVSFVCSGRNSCRLIQVPTRANPEAIIDMDDVAPAGPSTYSATLSFTYIPSPPPG